MSGNPSREEIIKLHRMKLFFIKKICSDKQYESGMVPDYNRRCIVCGAKPIVPITQMCGPCTFGEAATADGNWGTTKKEER